MRDREAWLDEQHWQKLDEAEDVLDQAVADAYRETGGHREGATRLLERRSQAQGGRLQEAMITVLVHQATMAYNLVNGYEPVPGRRGFLQKREGGPLPRAEQERLADELGVPLDKLEDAASYRAVRGD